jgi:RNAse (barnase) inhibitor barstar
MERELPTVTNLYQDDIFANLPNNRGDNFESLWDEKPNTRKWNRRLPISMDADMFEAVQDLIANKDLPFKGSAGTFGRHAVASTILALQNYLSKDVKTLWAALQTNQRRLTAERYVVVAEDQVKEAAELLAVWTASGDWDAVLNDLTFAANHIDDLPQAAWRKRVAHEWLINPDVLELLKVWEESMANESPESWRATLKIFNHWHELVG